MSQSTAAKKANLEHPSMTTIFWSIIILGILSISVFAGWLASRGGMTQPTPESQEKSAQMPTQSPMNSTEIFSKKTAMGWKTVAQQVQQTEIKTLQMLAQALDKLPDLAPLPRPNLPTVPPAPPKSVSNAPIAWKLLSEQLIVTEQQHLIMLQNFLAKAAQ